MTDISASGGWPQADPDRVALDRRPTAPSTRAGELLARANQVAHGLRALGLEHGRHGRRRRCPNGDRDARAVPRRPADRALHHADQPPPRRPRDRLHRRRLRRQGVHRHERFADARHGRGRRDRLPRRAAASPSAPSTASGRTPSSLDGQPDDAARGPDAGAAMHYTSGTTGRPRA